MKLSHKFSPDDPGTFHGIKTMLRLFRAFGECTKVQVTQCFEKPKKQCGSFV